MKQLLDNDLLTLSQRLLKPEFANPKRGEIHLPE
jgi:hypothetical protein